MASVRAYSYSGGLNVRCADKEYDLNFDASTGGGVGLADVISLLNTIAERQERLERVFTISAQLETYTVEQAAARLGRAAWTVRQWCNEGQAEAKKIRGRGGRNGEWRLTDCELKRLQSEGPKPFGSFPNGRVMRTAL
jgi:hypothetical protein